MLLESLLDNLAARQKDSCASVRRLVLRGLANVATGSPDKVSCPARPAGPARGRGEGGRLRQRGSPGRRAWRHWDTAVWPPQVRAHGPQLLTAMIGGLDDGDAAHSLVALEAMVGLARLLDLVEAWDLRSVLLHVAIRIRPFFDSVGGGGGNPRPCNPARGVLSHMPTTPPPPPGAWCLLSTNGQGWEGPQGLMPAAPAPQEKMEFRAASIRLFGHLNKACRGDCEDVFLEQVVGGLAPLLLHLRDPQAPVTAVSSPREMGRPSRAQGGPQTQPGLCRPAGSPCACAAPIWSVRSWPPSSRSTYRRAGACTSGSFSTPPASTW